jgi:hypothetical protein
LPELLLYMKYFITHSPRSGYYNDIQIRVLRE